MFDDEMLELHDEEISILQARLDTMQPMLKMIEKREEIILEREEYEILQKDPDRLKQRGGALTKQLMKEEKMQKRIKKDLPKYNDILTKKLMEWEKEVSERILSEAKRAAISTTKLTKLNSFGSCFIKNAPRFARAVRGEIFVQGRAVCPPNARPGKHLAGQEGRRGAAEVGEKANGKGEAERDWAGVAWE